MARVKQVARRRIPEPTTSNRFAYGLEPRPNFTTTPSQIDKTKNKRKKKHNKKKITIKKLDKNIEYNVAKIIIDLTNEDSDVDMQ
jgi:hypothetical protein